MEVFLALLVAVGFFALIAIMGILNAFVFTKLWAWFVIPVFGLPTLSLAQAYGIMMVVSFLTKSWSNTSKKTNKENLAEIGVMATKPIFVLAIAYFVKSMFL